MPFEVVLKSVVLSKICDENWFMPFESHTLNFKSKTISL